MKCFFVTVVNCSRAEWYTELWFRCVPEQHGSFFYVHVRVVTRQQSFDSCPVFCRFAQISRCEFDLHWDRVSTKGEDSSQRWRVTSGKFYWVVCNPKKKTVNKVYASAKKVIEIRELWDIKWIHGDPKFLFECWKILHLKRIIFLSPSGHLMFYLLYWHKWNRSVPNYFIFEM